jgi:hypothetical protein
MIGRRHGDPGWMRTRPPLVPIGAAEQADLARRLNDIDTQHPGASA